MIAAGVDWCASTEQLVLSVSLECLACCRCCCCCCWCWCLTLLLQLLQFQVNSRTVRTGREGEEEGRKWGQMAALYNDRGPLLEPPPTTTTTAITITTTTTITAALCLSLYGLGNGGRKFSLDLFARDQKLSRNTITSTCLV